MRAAAPRQGVPDHLRQHAGAVVDEGHLRDGLLAGVGGDHDVDAGGTGLDGVVQDLPAGGGSVPIAAAALGLDGVPHVEQREGEVIGQVRQVLLLALQLVSKASLVT
jgi:hypothetical protein